MLSDLASRQRQSMSAANQENLAELAASASLRSGRVVGKIPRGFTLIELFLGILVASILGVIIFAVITSQSRAYNIQERMAQMQQALRVSMGFMSRDVSMAGYGMTGYTVTDSAHESGGLLPAIRGFEGVTGSDAIQIVYADPARLVMTAWSTNQTSDTTQLTFQNFADVNYFLDSEYMLCFDYSAIGMMKSFLFRLTGYSSETGMLAEGSYDPDIGTIDITVPDNSEHYSGPNGQAPTGSNLPRDLQCGPANIHTYYIDRDDGDGVGPGTSSHPVLMMSININAADGTLGVVQTPGVHSNDVALADNIEDLQVRVCYSGLSTACDDDTDFVDWNAAPATLNTYVDVNQVLQVKITLVARSDRAAPEGSKVASSKPLATSPDGYYYKAETTTVLVRNLWMLAMSSSSTTTSAN